MTGKGKILRIYASHTDRLNHAPLYEAVVREAERMGMAGATVYRGIITGDPGATAPATSCTLKCFGKSHRKCR